MRIVSSLFCLMFSVFCILPTYGRVDNLRDIVTEGKVLSLVRDGKGRTWLGTSDGLIVCPEGGEANLLPLPSLTHHPFPSIYALAIDSLSQSLWIGAWNHLYCYNLQTERFVTMIDSLVFQTVSLEVLGDGSLLAYTQHGLYRISDCQHQGEQLNTTCYCKNLPLGPDMVAQWVDFGSDGKEWRWLIGVNVCLCVVAIVLIFGYRKKRATVVKAQIRRESIPDSDNSGSDVAVFADRATGVVERYMGDESFSVDCFAREMAVSRAQLFRKMKAANGMTPNEFVLRYRMSRAVALLQQGLSQSEVALRTGYADASSFRRAFVKVYGISPSEHLVLDSETKEKNVAEGDGSVGND